MEPGPQPNPWTPPNTCWKNWRGWRPSC